MRVAAADMRVAAADTGNPLLPTQDTGRTDGAEQTSSALFLTRELNFDAMMHDVGYSMKGSEGKWKIR
jgi:hypothetical protein